jgi:hypothetical protein
MYQRRLHTLPLSLLFSMIVANLHQRRVVRVYAHNIGHPLCLIRATTQVLVNPNITKGAPAQTQR